MPTSVFLSYPLYNYIVGDKERNPRSNLIDLILLENVEYTTQDRSDSHTQKGWPYRFPPDIGDTRRLIVSIPEQIEPFSH